MKPERTDFTLNLRDVLRNVIRHTQGDLARLAETMLLIVESRDWKKYDVPSIKELIERSPVHGGCGVPVAEIVIYLRVSLELGQHTVPTQQALEQLIDLLEARSIRERSQRRRRRKEKVVRLLRIDDVLDMADAIHSTLTPAQLTEFIRQLRRRR